MITGAGDGHYCKKDISPVQNKLQIKQFLIKNYKIKRGILTPNRCLVCCIAIVQSAGEKPMTSSQ